MQESMTRRDFVQRLVAAGAFMAVPEVLAAQGPEDHASGVFLVKPYVQLGNVSARQKGGSVAISWHTADTDADWSVEYRPTSGGAWKRAAKPTSHRLAVVSVAPHRVCGAVLAGLQPGTRYEYRVLMGGQEQFRAHAQARKGPQTPYRFVVFGDCGAGTAGQKQVAYQAYLAKPDFVLIPGDIVYDRGRISEYRTKFFPIYNAEQASPEAGAPLMRDTLFIGNPGNHDVEYADFTHFPDTLAYYMYWDQPLNGPIGDAAATDSPRLRGDNAARSAFLASAARAYPRLGNYSFDYANAHWLTLDSCSYINPNDASIRDWITKDLAAHQDATWRFVTYHHPGFNSSPTHFHDQWMRALHPLFEQHNVDVIFTGHVHNYQRTYPLRFEPATGPDGRPLVRKSGEVEGKWTLDKGYDGKANTRPNGIIQLVSGAGGNSLYDPGLQRRPADWQPFTCRYVADRHSLTRVDVADRTLSVQQIDASGAVRDEFVITK